MACVCCGAEGVHRLCSDCARYEGLEICPKCYKIFCSWDQGSECPHEFNKCEVCDGTLVSVEGLRECKCGEEEGP